MFICLRYTQLSAPLKNMFVIVAYIAACTTIIYLLYLHIYPYRCQSKLFTSKVHHDIRDSFSRNETLSYIECVGVS